MLDDVFTVQLPSPGLQRPLRISSVRLLPRGSFIGSIICQPLPPWRLSVSLRYYLCLTLALAARN